jgi:hypothetical protein
VTATAVVAIVGAVATPVVAIAGYLFNEASSRRNRSAALDLSRETHSHELELRRRERSYDDVKTTYRAVLEWGLQVVKSVMLTDPIRTVEGMPEPPEPPTEPSEEQWDKVRIDVSVFGSEPVEKALDAFREAARDFYFRVGTARVIGDLEAREAARERAGEAYMELAAKIKAEIRNM